MTAPLPTRDDLAGDYYDTLPYEPYPVQEDALLQWFTCEQGVLVCAPTGTGKTLIAEAAMYEALRTGKRAYYTTPLIALTEQKLIELRAAAVRWGFREDDVGLVTGNRRVNPDAPLLVVVAEILFNRLLHPEDFDFENVSSVVMDEFHSFNDPERGVVWELSLGLLPEHIRLLLLSATVGNSSEFVAWLSRSHQRRIELVEGTERKVPLAFEWVGDTILVDQIERMAAGNDEARRTPALIFCFNREECWNVGEQLKGKKLIDDVRQKQLVAALEPFDWSQGVGPKLRQLLMRGVGLHHAGVLPVYKRIVEDLYQQKLLTVTVCTETLAAGINLPARSVVIPNLLKGPPDKKKVIEVSAAQQMFGRAGRPQFDDRGFVYALAHEDDVKIHKWREKFDQIPEDTKDPGLLKAKKALKKKMPKRRSNQQYWTEEQFNKLIQAPSGNLESRGTIPWRLLAYLLDASPEVDRIRQLVAKRLMHTKQLENAQKELTRMLVTLHRAGYVELAPRPPSDEEREEQQRQLQLQRAASDEFIPEVLYQPATANPTDRLDMLLAFRGINPLYGVFLINHLGAADRNERVQAIESILEMPRSVSRSTRVPPHDELAPGPLATTRLDEQLLKLGLALPEEIQASEEEPDRNALFQEDRIYVITLAEKLHRLFNYDFPGVHGVRVNPTWAAGELLQFGGDFNRYITSHKLQKQEGVIFRHLLRMILMIGEFTQLTPPDTTDDEWLDDMHDIRDQLTNSCRAVDPLSTDKAVESAIPS